MIADGEVRRVIRAIVSIEAEKPEGGYSRITEEQGEDIARLFRGSFELFRELDEAPGRYTSPWYHGVEGVYGYDTWHWKLRQARNSCELFFEIIEGDKAAAV